MQLSPAWTEEGKKLDVEDLRTKYDKGNDYGMSKIGKAEWNVQADAFMKTATGKTLAEVKALVAENGAPQGDLATAGCTMAIGDMIAAATAATK